MYYCNYCGKLFAYASGLSKHKKTCKQKEDEISELKQAYENERVARKLLEKRLEKIENNSSEKQNIQVGNVDKQTNIETQQNNNLTININAVGHENLNHITDQIIIKCIGKVYESIPQLLKHIHYDPNHPENANVKIPNKKLPYASVYKKRTGKWETIQRDDAIDDMVDRGYNILDENYPDVKSQIPENHQKHFERFQTNYESDPNVKKTIKKDVDMMVIDSTR